jgi:cytochrome c oxidase assembly protein subunit 15
MHRLYGAAVGLATVFLAGWFLVFERRLWMKSLGVIAVVAVIVQGVLGGTRVTELSTLLAAVHGCMGQAFFGLMVALCVLTNRRWQSRLAAAVDRDNLRRGTLVIAGLVAAQVALGSWLRHYGTWAALGCHGALGMAVWILALSVLFRVERQRESLGALVPSARALAATSTLQIVLGIVAMIMLLPFDGFPRPVSFYQAVIRTGHQTNGALLLGATVVLTMRTFRHLVCSTSSRLPEHEKIPPRLAENATLDWEAVA